MKKLLALILTAVLCLCCFTACDLFKKDEKVTCEQYENCAIFTLDYFEGSYSIELPRTGLGEGAIYYQVNLEHGRLTVNYKDVGFINEEQKLAEFTADDEMPINSSGGYIEGDKIEIFFGTLSPVKGEIIIAFTEDALKAVHGNLQLHKHTYEYIQYETGHFKQYTCGCPSPDIMGMHCDNDENDACDICGYYLLPDENHFIRNQAGAEWLCEITADDIAEIKITSGGGGPLPPVSFTHISSSRNKAVISNIFEEYYWLDSKPVPEERTQIADGGYVVVEFILNNGAIKKLNFINGDFYHDGNGNYFELVRLPVFRDGTNFVNHYGFEIWEKYCQVHLIDETFVCQIPVSEFEFEELTDCIYLGDTDPTRYIEMNGERLYFILDSYFYIGDDRSVYYQLVGKNLDELIVEYSVINE